MNDEIIAFIKNAQSDELDLALKKLHSGKDINIIMEKMSERIKNKAMHVLIDYLKTNISNTYYDNSRELYQKNYLDKISPRADHITDNS